MKDCRVQQMKVTQLKLMCKSISRNQQNLHYPKILHLSSHPKINMMSFLNTFVNVSMS